MRRNSTTQDIINELCKKLHCSELAEDMARVRYAREMLTKLQQTQAFTTLAPNTRILRKRSSHASGSRKVSNFYLKTKQILATITTTFNNSEESSTSEESIHTADECLLPEEEYEIETSSGCEDKSDDAWLGFFPGFEILEQNQPCFLSENKQCIELMLDDEIGTLETYLRAGIRCFMIDLFVGTETNKQKLILKLKESELKVSQEYGFPIFATLFAMLSPRLQYTGVMDPKNPSAELRKEDETILTTKLKYSSTSNSQKIYVNAAFLIADCRKGDIILVGPAIQLVVNEVCEEELKCIVIEPGILSSRLPVRFPARCSRLEMSLEELEDLTFAREVGINVLVSYKPGTQQYFNGLCDALRLLKYENLRIFTRLVLNEYEGAENRELDWIAESYDGFFVELSARQDIEDCEMEDANAGNILNILNLSPASTNFMTKIYNLKKPIILNPCLIAARQLYVQPYHIPHIFYYPDKFIFSQERQNNAFYFYFLQNALTKDIPPVELSKLLFCDSSELGDDSIARACVSASLECQAKAIVVCSAWTHMSIKLSHFRPTVPIIHVASAKSISDYISLYHHIIFMHFKAPKHYIYTEYVINAFIFSLIFLSSRKIVSAGENVMLVYGSETATKLCDNYLVYKYDETRFANNLVDILFV